MIVGNKILFKISMSNFFFTSNPPEVNMLMDFKLEIFFSLITHFTINLKAQFGNNIFCKNVQEFYFYTYKFILYFI